MKKSNESLREIKTGGERGIRTLDTRERILTFQASPFSHSGTSPIAHILNDILKSCTNYLK